MVTQIKKIIKHNAPIIINVIKMIRHLVRHLLSKVSISRLLKEKKKIYLEIGSGDKKGVNEWITIDMTEKCDIYWDLRKGLPFPKESISKIYSSHFFEHLSFKEGQKFLDDCLRVLVPGGTFSICVPNARIYIESYLQSDSLDHKLFLSYQPAYNNTGKIDELNYIAYMDGHHKYMFDEENLIYILKSKGFTNVSLREFDPNLDLKRRDYGSIYAKGEK